MKEQGKNRSRIAQEASEGQDWMNPPENPWKRPRAAQIADFLILLVSISLAILILVKQC